MDAFSRLGGQGFVWDTKKARLNFTRHGIRFEEAREAFFDELARYEDASVAGESRQACVGLIGDYRLLVVVHLIRDDDVLRIISARPADAADRRRYEDD